MALPIDEQLRYVYSRLRGAVGRIYDRNLLMDMDLRVAKGSQGGVFSGVVTPPFIIAVVLLGMGALLAGPIAAWKNFKQNKKALPLKVPLDALAAEELAPYEIVKKHELDQAMVEALGTTRYINWTLEDASVAPNDPLRYANLFVTYYSGGSALVPHTPDVCYLGSGYAPDPAFGHENTEIEISALAPSERMVPIRVCTFVRTAVFDHEKTSVVYTFHSNGRFTTTRTGVRLLTHDPRDTHAYFCKVEASFPRASREENVEGAKKLFNRLLPVLIRDHWPDFEAAERAAGE